MCASPIRDQHPLNHIVDFSYREGDLRLVGGPYNWEGRVEVFLSGTWSTIRDTSWTNADATVVCNQLGFKSDGKFFHLNVMSKQSYNWHDFSTYIYIHPCSLSDIPY